MRVQEKLRLEWASVMQRTSIKEHIAWLNERIARLDADLNIPLEISRGKLVNAPRNRNRV
jgi:transposase